MLAILILSLKRKQEIETPYYILNLFFVKNLISPRAVEVGAQS